MVLDVGGNSVGLCFYGTKGWSPSELSDCFLPSSF